MAGRIGLACTAGLFLVIGGGCIKRLEHIRIQADGAVAITSTFEGDPADVHNGDPAPSADGGWIVQDEITVDKEDKQTLTRTARLSLKPEAPLPDSYAVPGSPLEPLALQFPTELRIEQRPDGTYYHFGRVYQARRWAEGDYPRRSVMQRDEVKKITESKPEDLTGEQREVLVKALLEAHAAQQVAFLQRAYDSVEDRLSPEAFLAARRAALDVVGGPEVRAAALSLMRGEQEDESVEALADRVLDELRAAADRALRQADAPAAVAAQLLEEYDLARKRFEITEDLGDEEWVVQVQMPGRIIAHNGHEQVLDSADHSNVQVRSEGGVDLSADRVVILATPPGNAIEWKFNGEALHDRDVVLMATSFVPR